MYTKDSFFFNYCGIEHDKPRHVEYRRRQIKEEQIKLSRCTEVSQQGHHQR